jgi:hypothetical protein
MKLAGFHATDDSRGPVGVRNGFRRTYQRRIRAMSTASPLLPLFKEQLEAECADISRRLNLADRGHQLIYWYFARFHNLSDSEVDEIFCDGGGDLGGRPRPLLSIQEPSR